MTKDELIALKAQVKDLDDRLSSLEESIDRLITVLNKLIHHTQMFN